MIKQIKFQISLLFLFSAIILQAQLVLPRVSPDVSVFQKVGTTDVIVKYCSPSVNERVIWGDLVPYDEVWRAGANEATTMEFSTDVKLNGNDVKAGKYALFLIPTKGDWTLILNSDAGQWGAYSYDKTKDVLRTEVKPEVNEFTEQLRYDINFVSANVSNVSMLWEKLKVSFTVEAHLTDPTSKEARQSPLTKITQKVGLTNFEIVYGAPGVKGRKIWGELVPFDKVWRAGANEATTIEFNTDVKLEGHDIPAGKYSLFTIPSENQWTIILNKAAEQWGAYKYDESQDFIRFMVTPEKSYKLSERLKFGFREVSDLEAVMFLAWENIVVPVKVAVNTHEQALKNIETAINEKPDDWVRYAQAAQYSADGGVFLDKALGWVDKSLELKVHYWNCFIKAKVLLGLGNIDGAKEWLAKTKEEGAKVPDNFKNYEQTIKQFELQLK